MRTIIIAIVLGLAISGLDQATPASQPIARSYRLQDLNWQEAEQADARRGGLDSTRWRERRTRTTSEAAERSAVS